MLNVGVVWPHPWHLHWDTCSQVPPWVSSGPDSVTASGRTLTPSSPHNPPTICIEPISQRPPIMAEWSPHNWRLGCQGIRNETLSGLSPHRGSLPFQGCQVSRAGHKQILPHREHSANTQTHTHTHTHTCWRAVKRVSTHSSKESAKVGHKVTVLIRLSRVLHRYNCPTNMAEWWGHDMTWHDYTCHSCCWVEVCTLRCWQLHTCSTLTNQRPQHHPSRVVSHQHQILRVKLSQ